MPTSDSPTEIALLLYPDVASATVYGLTDLFSVATTLIGDHNGGTGHALRVSHWQPNVPNGSVDCAFDTHPQFVSAPVAVIVPGSWQGPPTQDVIDCLVNWLVERHSAGSTLCSVCGGAFVLAETGLLAGRTATTHWSMTQKLAQSYPDIMVDENKLTVEDGNFITAGGVLAWTDLGLKLVDRYLGPTIMLETARFMLADPPGREQRFYSNFARNCTMETPLSSRRKTGFSRSQRASLQLPRWRLSAGLRNEPSFVVSGRRRASLPDNTISGFVWERGASCSNSPIKRSIKSPGQSAIKTPVRFEKSSKE